jgi:hypothetical protein
MGQTYIASSSLVCSVITRLVQRGLGLGSFESRIGEPSSLPDQLVGHVCGLDHLGGDLLYIVRL